jgi:hypothetical protein
MVTTKISPEEQTSEVMKFLHSSNLHYSAQVTPFSVYITVRKKFRDTSLLVIPDQASQESSKISISKEAIQSWKTELNNQLKQKALECHELEVSRNLLRDTFEKATDHGNNIEAELEEKSLESHELKATTCCRKGSRRQKQNLWSSVNLLKKRKMSMLKR